MRWRYPDETNREEESARKAVIGRIDKWWSAFAKKTDALDDLFSGGRKWDLPDWMHKHLQSIAPELMWEFGPGVNGGRHRLVITPEADRHLRPLVEVLLARAPAIPGWSFHPYRLAEDVENAAAAVQGRVDADIAGGKASAGIGDDGWIDLVFQFPEIPDTDTAKSAAFVAAETLLGEECLDTRIGVIMTADDPPRGAVPLARLAERVAALADAQQEQLPKKPCRKRADKATWSLVRMEPAEAPDYPGQDDMCLAKSMYMEMWQATRSGRPFYSQRHSAHGETFCYVKVDGSEGLQGKLRDKSEIEDALDAALAPAGLGTVIGGGTGLRYSYVDLALEDVGKAIGPIRQALRDGGLPRRSWLLFFDSILRDEWVGIWDDSPPPPAQTAE